jgi:hypothetical protein
MFIWSQLTRNILQAVQTNCLHTERAAACLHSRFFGLQNDLLRQLASSDAEPAVLASFNTPMIQPVSVNYYLGTAEGALKAALDIVRSTTRLWVTSGVSRAADAPFILERVGEFTEALKASATLVDVAAAAVQDDYAQGQQATAHDRSEAAG